MVIQNLDSSTVLAGIPLGLRGPLLQSYNSIVRNFREGRWEPAELNGGKLCEIVYTILKGHIDGKFPSRSQKPKNMYESCKAFEQVDATKFSRAVRIHIPRTLVMLYEIRNNRNVGHTGGDVDPNYMDSVFVLNASKWIVAELVRIFHQVDIITASNAVDAIVDRTLPLIWEIGENKRVLNPKLSMKDKTLALLYSCIEPIPETELFRWVEHSNITNFRRDILFKLHNEKLLEYDRNNKTICLSPTGVNYVETNIPLEL